MTETTTSHLVAHTADIVAAYAAHNAVQASDLPGLIADVHAALTRLGQPAVAPEPEYAPAVPVKKSITPDHLVSLIGRRCR